MPHDELDLFCRVEDKISSGQRLAYEDGLALFISGDLHRIGYLANLVRQKKNDRRAYFIVNRHINYTNVCKNNCRFCAFSKEAGAPGAYTMTLAEVLERAADSMSDKLQEFHVVGGLNPELPFDYYLDMISGLKQKFPQVHIQAFTAVEIAHLAEISGLSLPETLFALKQAGLGSLPGGGAEIFSQHLRYELCPKKLSSEGWLSVMRQAHKQGLRSNATMLYGHMETYEERLGHLLALRELQDETGGFMAFIPLAFHPDNTALEGYRPTTAMDDLKTLAISRLMLDNFPHIKAFWIMLGENLAQVSLSFGVDDLDGTVEEEHITHAAGAQTAQSLTRGQLVRLIRQAGYIPVERDTIYNKQQEVS
jgi:aminodeoxyfutalosine synthase